MLKSLPLLLLGSLFISSCNVGSMTETSSSGTKTYSKYYDAGEWLLKDKIGIQLVVEHRKIQIPVVYGIQRSIGALGPDDMSADGQVTIAVVNTTEQSHTIRVDRIVADGKELQNKRHDIPVNPKSTAAGLIGTARISNYATEIPIKVDYVLDGKKGHIQLNLPRRTYDELKRYYGPKGTPPYPWFKKS